MTDKEQSQFVVKPSQNTASSSGAPAPASAHQVTLAAVADANDQIPTVLLGSALIQVQGRNGQFYTLRAILDSAASSSYINHSAAKRIGLHFERTLDPPPVSGIGGIQTSSGIKGHTTCLIKPRHSDSPMLPTITTVIQKIVTKLPCATIADQIKSYFSDLHLSDPSFNIVKEVEFLIGADVFPHVYNGLKKFGPPGFPIALDSIFGWVITGRVGRDPSSPSSDVALIATSTTDALLRKFWELEEVPRTPAPHPDDVLAENIFKEKHYRLPNGRYVVPILLRENAPPLGESKGLALNRLHSIERRLNKNPGLKMAYSEFLDEYETLEHMDLVTPDKSNQAAYYVPHSCVLREDSKTTKLRVIFDASQKTSTGFSLNDIVYPGPKLQKDVFDVILKFRTHQFVFTCDISKMYRQILILPEERKYQHILWSQNAEIKEYELNTVTYGISSSPFVALRTVKQLRQDDGHKFPRGAKAADEDRFVDDIATGSHDVPSLMQLYDEVVKFLKLGGFDTQKVGSNCPELLSKVPHELRATSLDLIDGDQLTKILGIHWDAQLDCFFYKAQTVKHTISKRSILSHIARIYDPLGLISPIVFKAKTIMQKLWIEGVDWDSVVPEELSNEWIQFYEKLPAICNLKVNRCVVTPDAHSNSLVSFSDASKLGYCAALYLRSESIESVKVSLLAAKSRVAPTKTVSIPRLELCAAQLSASLIEHVKNQLDGKIEIKNVFAFSDSEVVLSWIKTLPCQLKTFEANRVTHILDRIEPYSWKFVPSTENPADVGSRGCQADQLENHPLWWTGPAWLTDPIEAWPNFTSRVTVKPTLILISTNNEFWEPLVSKFSSLTKLQRVTAWLLRYVKNLSSVSEQRVKSVSLSRQELDESMMHLIKTVQKKHFSAEIQSLKKGGTMPKNLGALQPFIDSNGVLRVGGRLKNANLPFNARHPILLPKNDHFVNILIDSYHKKYLHAGPRLLQSLLARQFWILAARSVIRSRLGKCVTCFKARPMNSNPLMGDLPSSRVTPSKAFMDVQVDFGGPFMIKEHKRRNPKLAKAYLSLFVCMATKAVHLEVVSELSTEALLATFDRFISRRGLCRKVLSDNATNFTGAKRHLAEIYDFLESNKDQIYDQLVERKIEWSFIPPSAPHFGGLHEAGIKSAKYHMKRIIGDQTLTFEEMTTVFSKIEAIMNSRPLCHMSTDAAENDVLTPGHFLVGGPLVAVPEYDFEDVQTNRLSRWQMLQKLTQHFWKAWSRDYLHTLIQRSKWQQRREDLKVGAVVIVADDDMPPTRWKKGVIEIVHPGRDKIVRVVTVRTAQGLLKRPAVKIYSLPGQ